MHKVPQHPEALLGAQPMSGPPQQVDIFSHLSAVIPREFTDLAKSGFPPGLYKERPEECLAQLVGSPGNSLGGVSGGKAQ